LGKKYRVLNLYAGVGGNRKLWTNVEVTAVELDKRIGMVYQDLYPDDQLVVGDAHKYLIEHYDDGWDFIWSSPPCQSHSQIRYRLGFLNDKVSAVYPDMGLYQEVILLENYYKGRWVVENVKGYYKPLIIPQVVHRHYFWSNFVISDFDFGCDAHRFASHDERQVEKGMNLDKYVLPDKRRILRECVRPELGRHVFNCAFKRVQVKL